jgi:hypothetical protein
VLFPFWHATLILTVQHLFQWAELLSYHVKKTVQDPNAPLTTLLLLQLSLLLLMPCC